MQSDLPGESSPRKGLISVLMTDIIRVKWRVVFSRVFKVRFWLTNHDRLTRNFSNLSLTANKVTAKQINQLTRTGLITIDWQQHFIWFWWWLPLRLLKRRLLQPTTALVRVTLTQAIRLHNQILLPDSNYLLYKDCKRLAMNKFQVNTIIIIGECEDHKGRKGGKVK